MLNKTAKKIQKVKGVLITPETNEVKVVVINNTLDAYYGTLECEVIDIATRKFGGKAYDIVLDDEGLLTNKEVAIITKRNGEFVERLVGKCFICNHDGNGNETSLTQRDIKRIMSCQKIVVADKIRVVLQATC